MPTETRSVGLNKLFPTRLGDRDDRDPIETRG